MHLAANLPHKIFAVLLEVMHRRDVSKARGELMHYDISFLFLMALPSYSHLSVCSLCFSVAENGGVILSCSAGGGRGAAG